MSDKDLELKVSGRRDFFKTASVGLAAGGALLTSGGQAVARTLTEKDKGAPIPAGRRRPP